MAGGIHIFVGDDDWILERAARKVIGRVLGAIAPELRATALETLAGNQTNMEGQLESIRACEASVMTPPFLEPAKVTWWKGVEFLPGGGTRKIAEDVKAALETFAERLAATPLPPNQALVVTAPHLLKTSRFAAALKKIAEIGEFSAGKREGDRVMQALARLPELAAEEKLTFAKGADFAFVGMTGPDMRTIVSELEKMRAYLGPDSNEITEDAVAQITSSTPGETTPWSLTDAIGARNTATALRLLSRFTAKSGWGVMISTILERFFRDLVAYRDALDRGWLTPGGWKPDLPPEARAALDAAGVGPGAAKNPRAARSGAQHAMRWSLMELRIARARFADVREKLVTSQTDDRIVETTLLRILALKGK